MGVLVLPMDSDIYIEIWPSSDPRIIFCESGIST